MADCDVRVYSITYFSRNTSAESGLNGLLTAIRDVVATPRVNIAVSLFMDLALATSFLGVALGI